MTTESPVDPVFAPIDYKTTLFEQLGSEDGVRRLVDRFYDLMEIEPDLKALRAAHGPDLERARERLYLFLCGYLGGPDLYVAQFGHPRLRARHLPFAIGEAERDQWVVCMGRAMGDVGVAPAISERLLHSFFGTADWMRNRAG